MPTIPRPIALSSFASCLFRASLQLAIHRVRARAPNIKMQSNERVAHTSFSSFLFFFFGNGQELDWKPICRSMAVVKPSPTSSRYLSRCLDFYCFIVCVSAAVYADFTIACVIAEHPQSRFHCALRMLPMDVDCYRMRYSTNWKGKSRLVFWKTGRADSFRYRTTEL